MLLKVFSLHLGYRRFFNVTNYARDLISFKVARENAIDKRDKVETKLILYKII